MSSIDLQVAGDLTSIQQVKDQNGNTSELYLSSDAVTVGTENPDGATSLTVYAESGIAALTSQRPPISGGQTRTHWKAQSVDSSGNNTEVWRLMTGDDDSYGFILRVDDTNRLIIDRLGNMTLNVASLKITGLESGASGTDLVIDSDGNVGTQ